MRWLRRIAIGVHALAALWLLVNGVGHSVAVIVRSRSGSLGPDRVPSLLAIGAGLVLTSIVFAATLVPLIRKHSAKPALGAVAMLAVVVALIAAKYGFTFLGGAIAIGVIDLAALASFALLAQSNVASANKRISMSTKP